MRRLLATSLAVAALAAPSIALAQQPAMPHPVAQPVDRQHGPQDSLPPNPMRPNPMMQPPHGPAPIPPHGALPGGPHAPLPGGMHPLPHAPHGEGEGEGGEHHKHQEVNFAYGLLGAKEGISEPSLAWRRPDMPVPFLANLINIGILGFLMVRFGKKPLADALAKRKTDLMREIDEAAAVKAEAKKRLAEYKAKIDKLDEDSARIKSELAEQAKNDETRILREAKEKRERMTRDAELLIDQEARSKKNELLEAAVSKAAVAAEALVKQRMTASDHDRLADEYLSQLGVATKASARGVV
jgi:F-type H+-transporting ATPase subunit b